MIKSCIRRPAVGWSLLELLLALAVLAAMSLAVWWALSPTQSAAEVKIEQDNLRALSSALEQSSGLLGSFEIATTERALADGLVPKRMIQDGQIRSAWGGAVSIAPRTYERPNDAMVITYQATPGEVCAQLASATVRGAYDIRVQDESVFGPQGFDPARAAQLCGAANGAVVEFIYRVSSGVAAAPVAPPPPPPPGPGCTPPGPETRPASCPAGQYGTRQQERTFSCPDPAGSPQPSPWALVVNNCTACPAATTEEETRWEARSQSCPAGPGTRTWEAQQRRTRNLSTDCPAGTTTLPAPTAGAWSAWADTGTRRNEIDPCVATPPVCGAACPMVGYYRDRDGVCVDYVPLCDDPPVVPPADCTITPRTSKSWTVAGKVCMGLSANSAVSVAHGETYTWTDPLAPTTGSAAYRCTDGVLATEPEPGASCVEEASGCVECWGGGWVQQEGCTEYDNRPGARCNYCGPTKPLWCAMIGGD